MVKKVKEVEEVKKVKEVKKVLEKVFDYEDIQGELVEKFFPNANKVDLAVVLNKRIVIIDVEFIKSSYTGQDDFAICLTKNNCTFTAGGQVVVKKLHTIKEKGYLPINATLAKVKGGSYGEYYDFISTKKK